jgi:hypothetical protein
MKYSINLRIDISHAGSKKVLNVLKSFENLVRKVTSLAKEPAYILAHFHYLKNISEDL